MGKGIIAGLFWGFLLGGVLAAFLSLWVPVSPTGEILTKRRADARQPEVLAQPSAEAESAVTATPDQLETAVDPAVASPPQASEPQAPSVTANDTGTEGAATASTAEVSVATEVVRETRAVDPASDISVPANSQFTRERNDDAPEVSGAQDLSVRSAAPQTAVVAPAESDVPQINPDSIEPPRVDVEIGNIPDLPVEPGTTAPSVTAPRVQSPTLASSLDPGRLKAPGLGAVGARSEDSLVRVDAPEPFETATIQADPQTPDAGLNLKPEPARADTPIRAPVPEIENPATGVVINRLPSVTAPPAQPGAIDTETTPETEQSSEVADLSDPRPPFEAFAAQAEYSENDDLLSIVLFDVGVDGVPREQILALDLPITIALDPTAPGAAQIMGLYRSRGFEVVALAEGLPVSATPSDVEVALAGYFAILSQAVGLMDPLDARIQSNRSLLQPVLGAIRGSGHGLVTYDRGLNSAQRAARRENIPAASVFRILDAELEEVPKIKRYMDRAAFSAGKDGSVVVLGRSYQDTITALLEWTLERKDGDFSIVPVSAIMARNQS